MWKKINENKREDPKKANDFTEAMSYFKNLAYFNEEGYDTKCDMWSIGVIAYIVLCGRHPFSLDASFENDD